MFRGFNRFQRLFATLPTPKELSVQMNAKKMFNRGIECWNKDDIIGAQECFELSLNSSPTSDCCFNLANVYHSQGLSEKAIEFWKKSLEFEERSDAHVNIANALVMFHQDTKNAIPHYEKALELTPNDGEIHYNFGVILDTNGDLERAIEYYSNAVDNGIDQAQKNLRNAKAKLIGRKIY